jgi:hypothetical protein
MTLIKQSTTPLYSPFFMFMSLVFTTSSGVQMTVAMNAAPVDALQPRKEKPK